MITKREGKITWIGLESRREHLLISTALEAFVGMPDKMIDGAIQEVISKIDYGKEEEAVLKTILKTINSAGTKAFAQVLVHKIYNP